MRFERIGTENSRAFDGHRPVGMLLHNPRVSQWRARRVIQGRIYHRYFDSAGRAIAWLRRLDAITDAAYAPGAARRPRSRRRPSAAQP
jgi:hypothetical protein